jgi:hypothetical protein
VSAFYLSVPLPNTFPKISYLTPTLCVGSCFAEHIAHRLQGHKLPTLLNPFGILYNPASIAHAMEYLCGGKALQETDLFEHQGLWRHFDFHSHYAAANKKKAWLDISGSVADGQDFLRKCDRLLITLGTAYAYERIKTGSTVANCHQLPTQHFRKYRLSVQECFEALQKTINLCRSLRPDLQVILTVSPVRHIRDGVIENQRSKSTLLLAAEAVCELEGVYYFPSYEILMDELRDYRFYARDRVHPSEEAVDYVWGQFASIAFEAPTQALMKQVAAVARASQHRPLHPESSAHQAFVQQQLVKISELEAQHPNMDFSAERQRLTIYSAGS